MRTFCISLFNVPPSPFLRVSNPIYKASTPISTARSQPRKIRNSGKRSYPISISLHRCPPVQRPNLSPRTTMTRTRTNKEPALPNQALHSSSGIQPLERPARTYSQARRISRAMSSTAEVILDPVESSRLAGLRYVSDTKPGITRKRRGKSFQYFDPEGKPIRDQDEIARIKSLAIPPAWTNVWICPRPNGHLQATGRDARGRKQSRYHPRWREVRDENKYDRMKLFGETLSTIRAHVEKDLSLPGLPRE